MFGLFTVYLFNECVFQLYYHMIIWRKVIYFHRLLFLNFLANEVRPIIVILTVIFVSLFLTVGLSKISRKSADDFYYVKFHTDIVNRNKINFF